MLLRPPAFASSDVCRVRPAMWRQVGWWWQWGVVRVSLINYSVSVFTLLTTCLRPQLATPQPHRRLLLLLLIVVIVNIYSVVVIVCVIIIVVVLLLLPPVEHGRRCRCTSTNPE